MNKTALVFTLAFLAATCRAESADAAGETPLVRGPVLLLAGEGAPSGLTGRLKLSAYQTAGAYGVIERLNAKIEGPNPHTHSHLEEAWYVIDGEPLFQSKDRQFWQGLARSCSCRVALTTVSGRTPGISVLEQLRSDAALSLDHSARLALNRSPTAYLPLHQRKAQRVCWVRPGSLHHRAHEADDQVTA
jgi:hypothetical protein